MMRSIWLSLCVAVLAAVIVSGQEQPGTEDESLFEQTIAQDIATASFYELVAWLESLGESTQGDRAALSDRLAGIYGVTDEQLAQVRSGTQTDDQQTLIIDSASRTRYFSLEEIEEQYVRLSGDVVVTLTDSEQDARHIIRAQEIVLNRDQNTMSASGAVVYLLEREGTTERFRGEALTVRLDDFSGAFVRGVTERERTIDGREIDFDFSGRYITRSEDEVIVLERGIVTSSEADPSNYYISADRIWVLSPGEWGLTNAVLHVGRVPVFYFPFFFRPGDELFFNPALGSRDRDGLYMQTTTYLVGTPPEGDTPLSILQLADEPVDQSQRVREGLFLVVPDESEPVPREENEDQVRVLVDLYTMLGAFVGIDGEIAQVGPVEDLTFFGGLGVSRHIYRYASNGQAYAPYYISATGARQSWNTTTIGSLELPVRIGMTLSGRTTFSGLATSLQFEAFSDSRFPVDFLDRAEQIDWLGLLGQSEPSPSPALQSALLWQAEARYTPEVDLPPALRTLALQRVSGSLRWASRQIDSGALSQEVLEADESPETMFFYPDFMRLPEITAQIGGTLLELPLRLRGTDDEQREDLPALIPPWGDAVESEPDPAPEDSPPQPTSPQGFSLTVGPLQPDLSVASIEPSSSARISYSVSPTVLLDHEFNDSQWLLPSDTDFSIAYRGFSTRTSTSLSYTTQLGSSLVSLNGSFSANGQYRSVFDRNSSLADSVWDSLEVQAWTFSSVSATNNNTLQIRPLLYTALLDESTLSHTVQTLLYRRTFDTVVSGSPTYTSEFLQGDDPEFVRAHRVNATAVVSVLDTQRLQLSANLPPLDPRYSATLDLRALPFTVRVATATSFTNESWQTEPLTASASVDFSPRFLLSSDLSFDLEQSRLDFVRTRASGAGVSLLFEARRAEGFTFGGAGAGWQPDGSEQLRAVRVDAAYALDTDIGPTWKNRFIADVQAEIGVAADLLRFTQSTLNASLSGSMMVHRFLALDLSVSSANDQIYVYVPALAEEVGRTPRSALIDLWRSVNFFSDTDRRESAFNLQRLQLSAIHDLGDWDLTASLLVQPELITEGTGPSSYELASQFSLTVQWRPIGELSSTIRANEDGISIGENP